MFEWFGASLDELSPPIGLWELYEQDTMWRFVFELFVIKHMRQLATELHIFLHAPLLR